MLSIAVAQGIAHDREGECLSTVYVNNKEKLRWRCKYKHEWEACLGKIKNAKQWCPFCGGKKKLTIETAQQIAIERGGFCLSTEYININAQLLWQCEEYHTWLARLHDVKNGGTWCPQCAKVVKLTIQDAYTIAHEREGQCLSDTYVNNISNLKWRCKFDHEWEACLGKIKNCAQWCPYCAGTKKLTIEVAQQTAAERGGLCLSNEYINTDEHLQWQCDKFHTWMASLNNVKNCKSWCPECAGCTKWTIEELDDIAIKNGGRCLSTEYINSQTHLEWMCAYEHKWSAVPNSIVQGSWCPTCNVSRGERTIIDWLSTNNIEFKPQYSFPGSRYSYDFYIPSTGWLIEFDGLQHFTEVPFFNTKVSFEQRQEIDRHKTLQAYHNNLSLLRIHYYDIKQIAEFLRLVTVRTQPQIICSRVADYKYLNLRPATEEELTTPIPVKPKHLTLFINK